MRVHCSWCQRSEKGGVTEDEHAESESAARAHGDAQCGHVAVVAGVEKLTGEGAQKAL